MVIPVKVHVLGVKTESVIKPPVPVHLAVLTDIIHQSWDVPLANKTVRHVVRSGFALNVTLDTMVPIAKLRAHYVKTERVTNKMANAQLAA